MPDAIAQYIPRTTPLKVNGGQTPTPPEVIARQVQGDMMLEGLPPGDFEKLTKLARTEGANRDAGDRLPTTWTENKTSNT